MKPWHVVLIWGSLNVALVVLLWFFHEAPLFVVMYAVPAGGGGVVLAAVLLRWFRAGARAGPRPRTAVDSLSAWFAGMAVTLTALGFVFGYWLLVLAAAALVAAFARSRWERLPVDVVTAPTEVPTLHTTLPEPSREFDRVARGVRVATFAVIGARLLTAFRRGRRRTRS